MNIDALIAQAEKDCAPVFAALEENEIRNTKRVLSAFQAEDIATRHFSPTTGYGYDDIGRDALERVRHRHALRHHGNGDRPVRERSGEFKRNGRFLFPGGNG